MPTSETGNLVAKVAEKPKMRRYRIIWPDNDDWKKDPTSKVFRLEMTDANADPLAWKLLGCYGSISSAQKAAEADRGGSIKADEWS